MILFPGNQYKVARFHLSSVPTRLGSFKVMRWDGCVPCGFILVSVTLSPHSLTESGSRLAHWTLVHWGSDRWGDLPSSEEVPR
jgi:hypothetical protein